jgi:hypothetical protein
MLRPPFFWTRLEPDPDGSRLYFGKSFIYPLAAAPLVKVFGTNGFLVLHALLLAGVAWCAYLFLHARAPAMPSVLLAGAFVMASVVPVYFVWITPEFQLRARLLRVLLLVVQGSRFSRPHAAAATLARRVTKRRRGGIYSWRRDLLEAD